MIVEKPNITEDIIENYFVNQPLVITLEDGSELGGLIERHHLDSCLFVDRYDRSKYHSGDRSVIRVVLLKDIRKIELKIKY